MESFTEPEDDAKSTLLRTEAEAFVAVCNHFFDQIPEPETDEPITLVIELEHESETKQVHFVRWPKSSVPRAEERLSTEGDEQGSD